MYTCGAKVTFVEVQTNNKNELADRYSEVAISSPDYVGVENDAAVSRW